MKPLPKYFLCQSVEEPVGFILATQEPIILARVLLFNSTDQMIRAIKDRVKNKPYCVVEGYNIILVYSRHLTQPFLGEPPLSFRIKEMAEFYYQFKIAAKLGYYKKFLTND